MIDFLILLISFLIVVPIVNYRYRKNPPRSVIIIEKFTDDLNMACESKLNQINNALNRDFDGI